MFRIFCKVRRVNKPRTRAKLPNPPANEEATRALPFPCVYFYNFVRARMNCLPSARTSTSSPWYEYQHYPHTRTRTTSGSASTCIIVRVLSVEIEQLTI
eukprot:scaffold497914_cov13-Prasinocladus_malaysianus.AAC.1